MQVLCPPLPWAQATLHRAAGCSMDGRGWPHGHISVGGSCREGAISSTCYLWMHFQPPITFREEICISAQAVLVLQLFADWMCYNPCSVGRTF